MSEGRKERERERLANDSGGEEEEGVGANRSLEAPLLLLSLPPLHCLPCVCVYTRTIYSGGGRGGDEEDIVVYVERGREDGRNGEPVS